MTPSSGARDPQELGFAKRHRCEDCGYTVILPKSSHNLDARRLWWHQVHFCTKHPDAPLVPWRRLEQRAEWYIDRRASRGLALDPPYDDITGTTEEAMVRVLRWLRKWDLAPASDIPEEESPAPLFGARRTDWSIT